MIEFKDLVVGHEYTADQTYQGDELVFAVIGVEKKNSTYMRIGYRWVMHRYREQYGDRIMHMDGRVDSEIPYHLSMFVIEEEP